MVLDAAFWVAVSFVVFIALVFKPVGRILATMLDDRAARIKNELGEALRLKEEAQALLASYQRKQKEVLEEAENILIEAEAEAHRIAHHAERGLDEALNKRIELAMQKIATYEATVIQDVKNRAIDVAIQTVRAIIIENLEKDRADQLVTQAIADMGKRLH